MSSHHWAGFREEDPGVQGLSRRVERGGQHTAGPPVDPAEGPLALIYSGPISQSCFPDLRGTGLVHGPSGGHSHPFSF